VVDVVVKNLRKKLGKKSELIETVAGFGYKLRCAAWSRIASLGKFNSFSSLFSPFHRQDSFLR